MTEIERMLLEAGIGSPEMIQQAKVGAEGCGVFIRSLVGLDREAAKKVSGAFPRRTTFTVFESSEVDQLVAAIESIHARAAV